MHRAPLWLKKANGSWRAVCVANVAFKPTMRAHHAQAVRPDQSHLTVAGLLQYLLSSSTAPGPIFLKTRGDNDGPVNSSLHAISNYLGYCRAGVTITARSTGSGTAAMPDMNEFPARCGRLGIDRVDRATKRVADQGSRVLPGRHCRPSPGCTDDRNSPSVQRLRQEVAVARTMSFW